MDDPTKIDTTSRREFVEYYAKQSLTKATADRFAGIRARVLSLVPAKSSNCASLRMLDIGCGPGMQSVMWAQEGHEVYGLDINEPLIEVARQRAREAGVTIEFRVGSAAALPYETGSMDVCLMPELLEHVPDWQACVNEAVRILRPGGVLFLSTTNVLCPVQNEFELPLYSWYPGFLKRRYEKLAITSRPALANFARYPAVHWFNYYQLRRHFHRFGMLCFDRFEMIDGNAGSMLRRSIIALLHRSAFLRFVGQLCSTGTVVFAAKPQSETKQ